MFKYFINIFRQLRKIFGIKGILEVIHTNLEDPEKSLADQETTWLDLKQCIFKCGSLYVKFLQWYISKLKSNILDNDASTYTTNLTSFVNYFEDIFENCPFHSLKETQEIFSGEGGMTGLTLSQYIDIDSLRDIASGSIGQVYYARRKSDSCEIAIKVKHPDIARNLTEQLSLIKLLSYLQTFKWLRRRYNLIFSIDDFLNDINQQCNFNNEANNNIKFRTNFETSKDFIVFPKVLFQSEDILVSEYIPGRDFTSLTPLQQHMTGINFVCFFNQMLFIDNFIHGDLHCKNWKVHTDEADNVKIVVYDTGICFSNKTCELTRKFWFALVKYDFKELCNTLKNFIVTDNNSIIHDKGYEHEALSDEELFNEIEKMFSTILTHSVGTGMIIKSIINYCTKQNIVINKFLLNLSITICLLEEFFRKTDMVDRERHNKENMVPMFDIINENQLDIVTFCKVKKCYPQVLELLLQELEDKYNNYRSNIIENNINEEGKDSKPVLFNGLSLSGLKLRPPTSLDNEEST